MRPIVLCVLLAGTAHPSNVDFAPLDDGTDCNDSPATHCRVRADADVAMLETMLREGRSLEREGTELVFAYRAEAKTVQLSP